MRTLFLLAIALLIFSFETWGSKGPISTEILTSYADQNGYSDNRAKLEHDKVYNASKGCCDKGAYLSIGAFGAPNSYRQVTIKSKDCGGNVATDAQVQLLQSETSRLFKAITGKELIEDQITALPLGKRRKLKSPDPNYRIRLSSAPDKCEKGSGVVLRVDFISD